MRPVSTRQGRPAPPVGKGQTASGRAAHPLVVSATPAGAGGAWPLSSRLLFGGPERLRVRPEDLRREFEEALRGVPQCSSNSLRHSATGWSDRGQTLAPSLIEKRLRQRAFARAHGSDRGPTAAEMASGRRRTARQQVNNPFAQRRPTSVRRLGEASWTR